MPSRTPVPFLDANALLRLARQSAAQPPAAIPPPADTLADNRPPRPCRRCAALVCPGWESLPSALDRGHLRRVASLRDAGDEEPTLDEHHPAGTHAWSADAPIAPAFFPYNRCEVWQCVGCARLFLRYTEYGGYYEDERIRALDPDLISPAAP